MLLPQYRCIAHDTEAFMTSANRYVKLLCRGVDCVVCCASNVAKGAVLESGYPGRIPNCLEVPNTPPPKKF